MTWAQALPHVLVAAALVYLPGLAVLWPARLPALALAAAAPMIGVLVLTGSALVVGLVGVGWSWFAVLLGVFVLGGAVIGLTRQFPGRSPARNQWRVLKQYLLGMLVAAAVLAPALIGALGAPEHFAQRHDNVFHLNAIRLVAEVGDGSPLGLAPVGAHGFYPAAWYDWAGLLMQLTDASVTVASNAVMLVAIFAIWPLSMAWLVETSLPIGRVGRLLTGPVALGSVSFPLAFLDWGPLFPNLLGLALAPVVMAAGWQGLGRAHGARIELPMAISLLVAGIAATVLTHPNAMLTAGLLLLPVAVAALVGVRAALMSLLPGRRPTFAPVGSGRASTIGRKKPQLAQTQIGGTQIGRTQASRTQFVRGSKAWTITVAVGIVAFVGGWIYAATRLTDVDREGFMHVGTAIGEVATATSLGKPPVLVISLGLVIGVLVAARRPGCRSLLAGFAMVAAGYVATTTLGNQLAAALFAAPYYNDPYRVAAVVALPTLLLAVLGWDFLIRWVAVLGRRGLRRTGRRIRFTAPLRTGLGGLLALVMALLVAGSAGWADSIQRVQVRYALDAGSDILTPDELALIERIDSQLPADAVIAANPWHGGALVYAFANRQVTQFYMPRVPNTDVQLINDRLNAAASDPQVCAALDRLAVEYALELEPHPLWSVRPVPPNPGLVGLGAAPGFELLDSQGGAALYRITACD